MSVPEPPAEVAAMFDGMESDTRAGLLVLRKLIFQTAAEDERIGQLAEALRWGEPAYLTSVTKSGTTLRLGLSRTGKMALFVHCRTSLISDFKAAFPNRDETQGTRAVLLDGPDSIDPTRHGWLIRRALTYHL